jgi:DNA-directed RNA polymerase specialized sigma24 family protein
LVSNITKQVPWKDVWRLYLEQQRVFESVFANLRAKGAVISKEMATDLIHEFLMERAPYALATFRSERGDLEPWLFVVFRRFVLGTYRSNQRSVNILSRWREDLLNFTNENYQGLEQDLLTVEAATADLPTDEKRAMTIFLSDEGGSVRAVARSLGLSRWMATRLIFQALARVVQALNVDIGVEPSDLKMLISGKIDEANVLRAAAATGRSADDVRSAIKNVRQVLARLLEFQRSEGKDT